MSELHVKTTSNQSNSVLKSQGDHKNISKHDHKTNKKNKDSVQEGTDQHISNCQNAKNTLAKKNESGKVQTIRKCIRKGSRVCYTDMEKITVLRKIPEKDLSKSSVKDSQRDVFEKIDSYRSGESLFKTFTFEQTRDIDDPETVKCIEFWKSVMKKNLTPIKCTLIESEKESKEKRKERSSVSSADKKSEDKKPEKKMDNIDLTDDGQRIWSEALKEIRKKKLDQLKMYVRERCQYCADPFTGDLKDEWGVQNLAEQQTEIISLNDWQPKSKQIDLTDSSKPINFRKRFSSKIKRVSTAQTIETRINEKAPSDQLHSINQSKGKITIPGDVVYNYDSKHGSERQDLPKRPASILKTSGRTQRISSTSDLSRRNTAPLTSTVEVQAPNVKCPCDSDTCICPHVAATRNSRTSFVEIARKNMFNQDGSVEKIFTKAGEECVCNSFKPNPWLKLTCYNAPCPAKKAKVKVLESSSDFNLPFILEKNEDLCVCTKKVDVVCPSENCKNKISQGSLVEGFPHVKGDDDFCVCSTNTEAPCTSDVCPTKVSKETSKTCVCGNNLPWIQTACQSWKCPHHRIIKRKIVKEEKIKFQGHPPIKKLTSTCMCKDNIAWNAVECECDLCASRPRHSSILKIKEKRSSTSRNLKSSSKDIAFGKKRKSSKSMSNQSLEKQIKERSKPKFTTVDKSNGCICSDAPPWKIVTCQKCVTKEGSEKIKANLLSVSADRLSIAHNEECVCKDNNVEPVCKVYQCKNKEISVDYPPPCLCPKDLDESKHEHFRCVSETCTMKKIDKACVCRSQPDAPCEAKTCVSKPHTFKTLVQTKTPLRYDAKCICKVRGLPTTQEVTCAASQCPFQRKRAKVTKKKDPMLFVALPREYKSVSAEELANKCICSNKDTSKSITCHSVSCRRKTSSFKSKQSNDTSMDYQDESEPELCICKDEQTDLEKEEEVICNHMQCPKTAIGEDGAAMNDKCVCANLDQACDEPTCVLVENEIHDKICSDLSTKERPYCYICGHYDCAGTSRKSIDNKVCKEVYTDIDEM